VKLQSVVVPTVVVVLLGLVVWLELEIPHEHSFDGSVEVAHGLPVGGSMVDHSNDCFYSPLSILMVLFHKRMEHHYNSPNLNDSSVIDTSVLPMDATTNHRKRISPRLSQGQRRHLYQAEVPFLVVLKPQLEEAGGYQFVPIPAPLLQ
jgi:hypothetical protein